MQTRERNRKLTATAMLIGVALLMAAGATAADCPYERAGFVADIPPGAHAVQGTATIIDDRTIHVDHFTYDGGAPAVYFYLGAENDYAAFAAGLQVAPHLDRAYSDESLTLTLPEGYTLDSYNAISVWCAEFAVNFSSGAFVEPLPGDCNCDRRVTYDDIDAFVASMSGQSQYLGAYPNCRWLNGDVTGDGAVMYDDIDAFVEALTVAARTRTVMLDFDGLEDLGDDYVYEGWLIIDGAPVSSGRFQIDAAGHPCPDAFRVVDANRAAMFVLTIEPAVDDLPTPADTHMLAGPFVGGTAALGIGHPAALGDDFASATGAFILATPSTGSIDEDYDQGIWWVDPAAGMPSLDLPALPTGWAYEGWVVGLDGPISTGRFLTPAGADSDAAGPFAGPDGSPPFPGQDFIDPAMSLLGYAAVISVEPEPDNSPAPFAIKPLVDTNIEDVPPPTLQWMMNNAASAPTGTVTVVFD